MRLSDTSQSRSVFSGADCVSLDAVERVVGGVHGYAKHCLSLRPARISCANFCGACVSAESGSPIRGALAHPLRQWAEDRRLQ